MSKQGKNTQPAVAGTSNSTATSYLTQISQSKKSSSELEEWEQKVRVLKQKAEVFTRWKDSLHCILSFPIKAEAWVDFDSFNSRLFLINQYVRELEVGLAQDFLEDKYKSFEEFEKDITKLVSDVERSLGNSASVLVEYLPQDMVENMVMPFEEVTREKMLPVPKEMSALAIDFALRQITKSIKEREIRRIAISGSSVEKVAEALKDLPEIKNMFDIVICISVSRHHSIKDLEMDIVQQINEFRTTGTPKAQLGNFLLLLDCINETRDLHELKILGDGCLVLTSQSNNASQILNVDLEIRTEDHLLPWQLFCKNVGQVLAHSSTLPVMAVHLIDGCHGHLLAIILLATALKDVTDIDVWKLALDKLTSQASSPVVDMSNVMVHALSFIWERKDIDTKNCIQFCTSRLEGIKFQKHSLVNHWIAYGLIENQEKGEDILKDLINSLLLMNDSKDSVRMREETRRILLNSFIPCAYPLKPEQAEVWDDEKKNLMNNKLTELPKRPICPNLTELFLQNSNDLMVIPTNFFEGMPALQVLDLSNTSIKSLPQSISKLVSLRKFLLKGCELLMKLPSEIGALRNLEEFDLEGTELVCLPKEIGELINLTCLRVSFYGYANRCRKKKQIDETIPKNALSKLTGLKELRINVNPDGEWWNEEVKAIIEGLCSLRNLKTLNLYLPTLELFQQFLQLKRNSDQNLIYPSLSRFSLTIGRHYHPIISRLPQQLEKEFKNNEKCLKYMNGEGHITEISKVLKHSNALFLARHWTVDKLSEFGIEALDQLKFCLLVECNEIRTIVDGEKFYEEGDNEENNDDECYESDYEQPVLSALQFLCILYMKNLESIWKGPIVNGCLICLKSLVIHGCPSLNTIFTLGLISNLVNLKELIVEDCPKIQCLISLETPYSGSKLFLSSLMKLSLLHLPELISMFDGLPIAAGLERMIVYNCPKLQTFSTMEVSSKCLKVIGESEWWDALNWHNLEGSIVWPDHLFNIFSPIERDGDLMARLTEDPAGSNVQPDHLVNNNVQKCPAEVLHKVLKQNANENENEKIKCKINVEMVQLKYGGSGGLGFWDRKRELYGGSDSGGTRFLDHNREISLQFIGMVGGSPGNEFQSVVGDESNDTLYGTFFWDEGRGAPGAFRVNELRGALGAFRVNYIKTLTITDVPGSGRIHFVCNSWIWAADYHKLDCVFFTNQAYIPSETPAPLSLLRRKELRKLRGDGTGMHGGRDLVYDYAYYNLGDTYKGKKHVRPILGGSIEYPYPRRRRICRPQTETDLFESWLQLDDYVPRDRQFDFAGYKWEFLHEAEMHIKLLLSYLDTPGDIPRNYPTFELDVDMMSLEPHLIFEYHRTAAREVDEFKWKTDEEFTREILAGVYPSIIKLLQEFPPTSKLDPKVYGNQISSISKGCIEINLDGLTLEEAIERKQLFILDYNDSFMPYLRRMNATSTRTYATRTILFLQSNGTLKPLAIELSLPHPVGDQFGAISKICTPAEHGVQGSGWQLAKAYVAVNDSGYQLISHWLNNNAVIEPFVIATNRQLSVLHPIYKLLHPQFRDIMQTNSFARCLLLNDNGVLEKTFSLVKFGMEMSVAAYKNWVFPEQALPVDLFKRGMAVKDSNSLHGLRLLLEKYPYAVHGLEIWLAIKTWVEDYCNFYYKTDDMVQKDSELQSWWKEIREVGHGDKKDEPWWPKMQTLKELMDTCTIIIWVASGLHAVVHYGQTHYAGYLGNRPTISHKFMPERGTPEYAELESNPEKAFLKTFNTRPQMILANFLIKFLCRQFSYKVYLGKSDSAEWTADKEPLEAFGRFQEKLVDIEERVINMKEFCWK